MIEALVVIAVAALSAAAGYAWARRIADRPVKDEGAITGDFYRDNPIPENFDPRKDGAKLLDDPVPLKQVIPTYYAYDDEGKATGEIKDDSAGTPAGMGLVEDPKFGKIQVYRQYIPRRDSVEYTIYFRKEEGGEKRRLDMELTMEELENFGREWPSIPLEDTLRNIFYQRVENGEDVDATTAVR